MANSSGIITAPVRQKADVQYVLTGSTSGNAVLSALCRHANINPFAKYKPVCFADSKPDRNAAVNPWWKAGGDCGLVPYMLRDYSDIVNHCDGTMNGWQYTKPTGGTYPYRLLDFDGYNHGVSTSVKMFSLVPPRVGSSANDEFVARLQNPSGTNALHWIDLDTIKYTYFGVYVIKNGGVTSHKVTAQTTLIGGGGEGSGDMFSVSTYGWSDGDYTVYPFFSEEPLTDSGTSVISNFWSIPMTSPVTLTVSSMITSVIIKNYKIFFDDPFFVLNGYRGYKIQVMVSIINSSTHSVTLNNNTGQVRYIGYQPGQGLVEGESEWSISSVTVNANSSQSVTVIGVITDTIYREGARLFVIFKSSGLTLTDDIDIDNGQPPQ